MRLSVQLNCVYKIWGQKSIKKKKKTMNSPPSHLFMSVCTQNYIKNCAFLKNRLSLFDNLTVQPYAN